jgi:type II secretory pathway predicted ATPase ExeA
MRTSIDRRCAGYYSASPFTNICAGFKKVKSGIMWHTVCEWPATAATGSSLRALHRASGGIPRLIDILAHKSLMSAYGEGLPMAELRHVRLERKDTEGAHRLSWIWI